MSGNDQVAELKQYLGGTHWVFLCFLPDRWDAVQTMIAEWMVELNRDLTVTAIHFPAGVLWNGEECHTLTVPKADIPHELLARGLRKHFGYENPPTESDWFTLGVDMDDDAELDRVGLFGE